MTDANTIADGILLAVSRLCFAWAAIAFLMMIVEGAFILTRNRPKESPAVKTARKDARQSRKDASKSNVLQQAEDRAARHAEDVRQAEAAYERFTQLRSKV